jgi:Uma2 family endonuclease
MQDDAGRYELRYDAAADSLLVRLAEAPAGARVEERALEDGVLVVKALEDGRAIAWEIRQASRQGPLLSHILASLREASGALDALAAEAPADFEGFLAWEAAQDGAYERLEGEVRRKPGGDDSYARLVVSLFAALDQRCHRADQRLHLSSLRVVSPKAGAVLYPPIVVRRLRPSEGEEEAGIQPVLVAEVVRADADPTALAPRLRAYEAIPGLARILLLTEGAAHARWRVRDADGRWRDGEARGREARVALKELDLVLPLDAVYAGLLPA